MTRLALASILTSSNLPSAVILDDALVNTDEERIERMQFVLRKASENLQVLILACWERDLVSTGGKLVRIQ